MAGHRFAPSSYTPRASKPMQLEGFCPSSRKKVSGMRPSICTTVLYKAAIKPMQIVNLHSIFYNKAQESNWHGPVNLHHRAIRKSFSNSANCRPRSIRSQTVRHGRESASMGSQSSAPDLSQLAHFEQPFSNCSAVTFTL